MKLILHIGTHKTGSTALQRFLHINDEALKAHGCLYPTTYRNGKWHDQIFEDCKPNMIKVLKQEFRGFETAVISYEGAYTAETHTIEQLKRLSDNIEIQVFFRNQVDWFNSSFNQQFKAHRQPIKNICTFDYRRAEIVRIFDLNFHLLRWERFFDRSQIKVIPYDTKSSPYDRLLASLGISMVARQKLNYPADNPNKAADLSSLRILYLVKKNIGNDNPERLLKAMTVAHRRLSKNWIDTRDSPPPMLLDAQDVENIKNIFQSANRALFSRYGLPVSTFSAPSQVYGPSIAEQLFKPTLEEIEIADAILATVGPMDV